MKTPRLKPLLYKDVCEEHGETAFIVEQQEINFLTSEVTFVFYCKKCWLRNVDKGQPNETIAWKTTVSIKEYNRYFGFNEEGNN